MAASGRTIEHVFTPGFAGKVKVTATLEASSSVGDTGTTRRVGVFCEQDGTTVYKCLQHVAVGGSAPFTLIGLFDVVASQQVKCGLWGGVTGAATLVIDAGAECFAELMPT